MLRRRIIHIHKLERMYDMIIREETQIHEH